MLRRAERPPTPAGSRESACSPYLPFKEAPASAPDIPGRTGSRDFDRGQRISWKFASRHTLGIAYNCSPIVQSAWEIVNRHFRGVFNPHSCRPNRFREVLAACCTRREEDLKRSAVGNAPALPVRQFPTMLESDW